MYLIIYITSSFRYFFLFESTLMVMSKQFRDPHKNGGNKVFNCIVFIWIFILLLFCYSNPSFFNFHYYEHFIIVWGLWGNCEWNFEVTL